MPDQKSLRIAELLVNEVIPQFGVPESLLLDRGTNLLSHLMTDVCWLLGIKKLNTTSHHSQCNRMVERFNRTLKTMLRKYAVKFSTQWDRYIPGALWAYRNLPHDLTGEKPLDCRTLTEALLTPSNQQRCQTTEKNSYSLFLQLGGWLQRWHTTEYPRRIDRLITLVRGGGTPPP